MGVGGGEGGALAIQIVTYCSREGERRSRFRLQQLHGGCTGGAAVDWGGLQLNKDIYLLPPVKALIAIRRQETDGHYRRISAAAQAAMKMCCEQDLECPSEESLNMDGR